MMRHMTIVTPLLFLFAGTVSGCKAGGNQTMLEPVHEGIETRLLDGDLVNFRVSMRGARGPEDVERYAECAAAQYTLIRGYGFARHVRTQVSQEGGIWRGDAVYTISESIPRGLMTLDAEVVAADCAVNGIPMV